MYTTDVIAERIKALAKIKNTSLKELLEDAGVSRNFMSPLRSGSMPRVDNLASIADKLECSVDYLMGKTDNPSLETKKEPTHYDRLTRDIVNILTDEGVIKAGIPLSPQEEKELLDCFSVAVHMRKKLKD